MVSARQNANPTKNTVSIPPGEAGKQAVRLCDTRFPTFSEWVWDNQHILETAQLRDGYDWLCSSMVDAPDQGLFEAKVGERGWFNRHGKRGGKEAFTASWGETKAGAPLLRITVNDFRRGEPQSWNGHTTITRLWDDVKGTPKPSRDARQQRQDWLERDTREYNAMWDAEERSRKEAHEAAQMRRALADALARYEAAPLATEPGAYFQAKGHGDAVIPGLKRGVHPKRGSYDVLPIRDAETGELTSLAYFWDEPFVNDDGEKVRKTFQWGGQITGCAIFLSPLPPKKWAGATSIGEGVATVLSVQRAALRPDVCFVAALAVDNLEPVMTRLGRRCKKATCTLILDNDWQKALEVDHKGNPKRNAGLEVGSELAMKRNLQFYLPDFTGYGGTDESLSDFNDLERIAGKSEVARQLTLRYPDPDVVFKGAREAETARLRAVFGNHDVTVVNQRYIPANAIAPGHVNILVSPPGSGKTTLTAAHQAAYPDARRLMINPLAALATTNAERFGMANYQALSDAGLSSAQQLSICQDSLPRLVADGSAVPHYDVVHLEEPETLLSRQTGDIKLKQLVRDVMRFVVSRAGTVIVADADADQTTLGQLERWRPGERFNVIINEHPMDIEVDVYAEREDVQAEALSHLEAGERLAYPCSTAIAAREVHGLFSDRLKLPGLCVTADNDGDAKVREFFRRPNAEAPKYSYVAYSPKIDTGLSVDAGHGYSRVFAEVNAGHDSPRRAMQRLHRFREVRRWSVYIDPAIQTHHSDRSEIARRWGEGVTKYDSQLLGINLEGRRGIKDADYEAMVLDATVSENIAKTNLRFNLLRRFYARGAKLRFVPPRGAQATAEEGTTLIEERKDLERADYTCQRLEAKPITDAQALAIDNAQRRTAEQSAQLDAWRIRRTFGLLPDAPLEDTHVSEYRRGQLATEIRRLELAGADQETLRGWSERQHELSQKYQADERYYGIEAHVYRSALAAYNVDPVTLTLANDEPVGVQSEGVQRVVAELAEHRDDLVAAGFTLPSPEVMTADPMRVLGNIVRRMRLATRTSDKVQRSRVIDEDGLGYVRTIILERQKRREERAAAVNSQQAAVNPRQETTAVNLPQGPAAVKVITKERELNDIHCRVDTTEQVMILPSADKVPFTCDRKAFLAATLQYIACLPERPTPELVYEVAVPILAITFDEAVQDDQYDKYRSRLLGGTPLEDASPDELRVSALAYFGWARDRQKNGLRNIGAWAWQELADTMIGTYRKRA